MSATGNKAVALTNKISLLVIFSYTSLTAYLFYNESLEKEKKFKI
jgi:hypothetical protein